MWQGIKPESYGLSFTGEYVVSTVYDDQEYPSLRIEGIAGTFDVEAFQLVNQKEVSKFKVGDEVIVIKNTPVCQEGLIGVILGISAESTLDGRYYAVAKDGDCNSLYYLAPEELQVLTRNKLPQEGGHKSSSALDKQISGDLEEDKLKKQSILRPVLEERKIGKIRMELFDEGFPNAILEVAKVMTWASENKGYKDHDWVNLPDADSAFSAAASRHKLKGIIQKINGVEVLQRTDEESNILHKAHEAFNTLAELELMLRGVVK
jgi:hypothetical protein